MPGGLVRQRGSGGRGTRGRVHLRVGGMWREATGGLEPILGTSVEQVFTWSTGGASGSGGGGRGEVFGMQTLCEAAVLLHMSGPKLP